MQEMKTGTAMKTVFICFTFIIFFFVHRMTLSSLWRLSAINSIRTQGKYKKGAKPETRSRWVPQIQPQSETVQLISCDRSNQRYDLCFIKGPTKVDPTTSSLSVIGSTSSITPSRWQKIRPYPRKWENGIMFGIKELTLTSGPSPGPGPIHNLCKFHHEAPALVFSSGGYTGNLFHDFNDGFIPLFITTRTFFTDRNVVLVIVNCRQWWLSKYAELLPRFTRFPIINLDNETATHCFPSVTIGLISQGYMTIDPKMLPHSETFVHFRSLLETGYTHGHHQFGPKRAIRPRLVIVSRTGDVGRVIVNQAEVVKIAEKVGFEVVIFEPTSYTPLNEAYRMINSSHAMIGVHGAALTHSLFLRPGSVFVQVVPIGIEWLAETCFGKSARDMRLVYMEYKIRVEESSLVNKYGRDDLVIKNPKAVVKQEWSNTKNIYLKNQDVILDLDRVGRYLEKAFVKAKRFMVMEG